jgi:hypothetical protein
MYKPHGATEEKAVAMIRKQVYIGAEHQQKLRRVAAQWGCAEAEVIRTALDQLPDPDASVEDRLADAGVLVRLQGGSDLPTGAAAEQLEQAEMAWLAIQRQPLGLADAVVEDRR